MREFFRDKADQFCVMSRQHVRDFDAWAINTLGISGVVLMENAGRGCAELVGQRIKPDQIAVIFCGPGNNGGDGYVIARHLHNAGIAVRIMVCVPKEKIKGDALENFRLAEKLDLPIEFPDITGGGFSEQVQSRCKESGIIVDALFGTGITGPLRGNFPEMINMLNASGKPIVAVDIPSGLDCDTAEPLGECVTAEATVTFAAVKKGYLNPESEKYTGKVYVQSIGVEPAEKY